jgi:hypothetical protein
MPLPPQAEGAKYWSGIFGCSAEQVTGAAGF